MHKNFQLTYGFCTFSTDVMGMLRTTELLGSLPPGADIFEEKKLILDNINGRTIVCL